MKQGMVSLALVFDLLLAGLTPMKSVGMAKYMQKRFKIISIVILLVVSV